MLDTKKINWEFSQVVGVHRRRVPVWVVKSVKNENIAMMLFI